MKARKCRILAILILMSFPLFTNKLFAIGREHQRFHSETNAYSFSVPKDWVQIPRSIILEAMKKIFSSEAKSKIHWETVFQRKAIGSWFQYPYVTVQVTTYSSFGLNRQIYESEFEKCVEGITGLKPTDLDERAFSTEAKEMFSDISFGEVRVNRRNRFFVWGTEIDLHNVGRIKGQMVGYFGKRAIVQLTFYELMSNWDKSQHERNIILGSFQFEPDADYDETHKESTSIFDILGRSIAKGIGVAVIVLVIGLFAAIGKILRPKKLRKTKDEQ